MIIKTKKLNFGSLKRLRLRTRIYEENFDKNNESMNVRMTWKIISNDSIKKKNNKCDQHY